MALPSTFVTPIRVSPRELEVLAAVSEGISSADVADRLSISKRTVDFHLSNVYRKLGVSNRMAAHREALKHGLIPFERDWRQPAFRRADVSLH